jgi:hypothetical protein
MTFDGLVNLALWTFVFACLGGIVALNLYAMFADYFIGRDK